MQCIVVKSDEFENSCSLLYILLKSCLCCCSLATLASQQIHNICSCHPAGVTKGLSECHALLDNYLEGKGVTGKWVKYARKVSHTPSC